MRVLIHLMSEYVNINVPAQTRALFTPVFQKTIVEDIAKTCDQSP